MTGRASARGVPESLARAAVVIAVLTVAARVTGLARVLVFARTVGQNCLGDTYQTVNTVPNIVFEVVAGGALASLVVPLLAGGVERRDRRAVAQTSSALLGWALLLLVPLAALVALLAHPIAGALLAAKPGCGDSAVAVGTSMLRVFAPQIPLYGVGIVLTGVLQAHRRFAGPSLAPLLSSMTVIGAYVAFGLLAGPGTDVGSVTGGEQLLLSLGTTAGVVVLTLCLLVPARWAAGVRLRATLRFPDAVRSRAVRLAGAGGLTLLAQQVTVLVALRLGNGAGVPAGLYTAYTYAQTIFLLPWAVLAVPVATSVFPQLAARFDAGDVAGYDRTLAGALRVVLLLALLGAAALVALASPLARLVVQHAPGTTTVGPLAAGIVGFAPGLVGYALLALLTRALYARGSARRAALATVSGWLAAVVAEVLLAVLLPAGSRVLALALGNTVGMTVLGLLLVVATLRAAGRPALTGAVRSTAVGLLAAVAGAGAALGVQFVWTGGGVPAALGQGVVQAVVLLLVFGMVVALLAGGDVRLLRTRLPGARRRS